jgi:hypothetical protein
MHPRANERTTNRMKSAAAAFLCAWALAAPAAAQQGPQWEVEAYGGLIAGQAASAGSRTLPAAGAAIATSSPIFPSREVPSWLFGDGASLLNGVNADFGLAGRITPLDAAFAPLAAPRTASFGVRVRRRISPQWAMELGVDSTASASVGAGTLDAAVESTRRSFETAFSDLLATGPFSSVLVRTTGAAARGDHRETAITFALNRRFGPPRRFAPYVTFGGGIAIGSGAAPSASLVGDYRFLVLGQVPIGEDDAVVVRYASGSAFVIVAGGGVQRDFSDKWGLRIDARLLVGPDATRVTVDATPTFIRAAGAASGFVESFTNPAIQFSNDPSTGRVSSLSGSGLNGADVFQGGARARPQITAGITRRF